MFAIVVGATVVYGYLNYAEDVEDRSPSSSCENVTYRISGTATQVSITLENADGNTEQFDPVDVPYTKWLGCIPTRQFVYISAQNAGETGTVECAITRGNGTVSSSRSSGAFVIASCSD